MKEVKYFVSDDGKQKSTNESDIIDYENIQNIWDKSFVSEVNKDDYALLFKLEGEKDLYYLSKYLGIRPKLEDNYVGYAISKYADDDCCLPRELISVDQYIKKLQSKIDKLNTEISTIKNYMK